MFGEGEVISKQFPLSFIHPLLTLFVLSFHPKLATNKFAKVIKLRWCQPGSEGLHFYVVIYIEYSIVVDIDT